MLTPTMDEIWAQVESLRKTAHSQTEQEQWPEYLCKCGGTKTIVFSNGDWSEHILPTCTSCGHCDTEYISDEPEWRGGIDDDGGVTDPSRCGAPTDDRFSTSWSMGTIMNVRSNSSYALKKLARIDHHVSMNYKDRSLFHNYKDFERAGNGLPEHVIRSAEHMYKKFSETKLTRGAVRMGIKANCLLHACKQNGIARSVNEMAASFGIPAKDISRTAEMFRETLSHEEKSEVQITHAADVVNRMFNDLTMIPDEERRRFKMRAVRICENIQECIELMGKTPKTIAATVIYVILENTGYVTKPVICEKCGVSAPTINKLEPVIKLKIKAGV